MTKSARISYGGMAVLLVLIAWLHLGPLVLTSMFGYFALGKLRMGRSKHFAVALYIIAVVTMTYILIHFTRQASVAMPKIADTTIPAVAEYAERHGVELPFTDYASLKTETVQTVKDSWANVSRHLGNVAYALAQLLVGLVVALSMFLSGKWGDERDPGTAYDSLYATVVRELATRFKTFYGSFSRVIGAQITISAINSVLTAVFLIWNDYPYQLVLIGATFLCGLLPIVGNLLSNTLIIGVSFTTPTGPNMALFALIFLVVIHKLEYFLNSKIIGDRIKNPMWLTLIGLVLGEKLMGIPGMILAPVVLHYIKVEASRSKLAEPSGDDSGARPRPEAAELYMPDDLTPIKQRAPTLYLIIAAKLIKGLALLLLALAVYSLSDNDLPKEFHDLLEWLHIDPEREFFTMLTAKLSTLTPRKVVWVAAGTLVYGLFLLVEVVGLYQRAWWAGWLVIISSLFFIPIEIFDLWHRYSWVVMSLLAFNLFIAWYLFTNRHQLFRHHH